jgi:hypothetical protein
MAREGEVGLRARRAMKHAMHAMKRTNERTNASETTDRTNADASIRHDATRPTID